MAKKVDGQVVVYYQAGGKEHRWFFSQYTRNYDPVEVKDCAPGTTLGLYGTTYRCKMRTTILKAPDRGSALKLIDKIKEARK